MTPKGIALAIDGWDGRAALGRLRGVLRSRAGDHALRLAAAQALRRIAPASALALIEEAPGDLADDAVLGLEAAGLGERRLGEQQEVRVGCKLPQGCRSAWQRRWRTGQPGAF